MTDSVQDKKQNKIKNAKAKKQTSIYIHFLQFFFTDFQGCDPKKCSTNVISINFLLVTLNNAVHTKPTVRQQEINTGRGTRFLVDLLTQEKFCILAIPTTEVRHSDIAEAFVRPPLGWDVDTGHGHHHDSFNIQNTKVPN